MTTNYINTGIKNQLLKCNIILNDTKMKAFIAGRRPQLRVISLTGAFTLQLRLEHDKSDTKLFNILKIVLYYNSIVIKCPFINIFLSLC